MANKPSKPSSSSENLPTVVVADQPAPPPPPAPPVDGAPLTRHEFVENYLPVGPERRMAAALLPDTQMGLGEWRERWRSILNTQAT